MSSPRSSQAGSSSGGAFSNFLPRFRRDSTASPQQQQAAGSSVGAGLPLSPPRFAGTEPGPANRASEGRRLSVSRGRSRELSPSPTTSSSQTISPRTSLTNLSAHARQQGMAPSSSTGSSTGAAADAAAAVKSTVSPPKLTLTTTGDGESGRPAQAIIIPSPSDATHPTSPFTHGREDDARTPTAEYGGRLGERDLRVGSGSLTLDDVPSGVAHHNQQHYHPDDRPSASRPNSPRKDSSASVSSANGGETSQRGSLYSSYDGASESTSLAAPSAGRSLSPDPNNASPDGKKARRKRGLSASSFTRRAKPTNGIAGAIAGMSKDLINPATGLSLVRSRQADDGGQPISGRPRGDTGESVRSSGSAKKASKKDKRRSTASSREGEVYENGISRTRASSISFLSSNGGDSPASYADVNGSSPVLSHRALVAALGDTDATSDYGDGRSAYSGGGDGEDDGGSMLNDSDDDLDGLPDDGDDYDLDDLPVTGFAVASVKRNADFHALFENAVPEDDYLIEDYGCALQREILLQGRLYVSENHICFHANIFGWVTNLVLPFSEMVRIDKKMTALIIPNAIQISTLHAKHTFASFLSRDTTYDVIHNIWRLSHPHLPSGKGAPSDEAGSRRQSNAGEGLTDEIGRSASPDSGGNSGAKGPAAARRQPTTCACLRKGEHYPEVAMDAVFPSSPEKIYNLIFTSGFSKDFMVNDQKLMELQVSDWKPQDASSSDMLVRSMSYIKPLAGGFGPKQTKCELKDETDHVNFDDYVSMLTTTRTPDVPSGGAFSVKTRTCLMWAGANSTRVLVTTKVEWTGRSFIKGIIESSALAGQKEFHGALEQAMRAYITAHLTEFHLEGVEDDADDVGHASGPGAPGSPAPGAGGVAFTGDHADEQAKKKAEQEGLVFQYGIDNIGKGAIEMLKGGWAIVESACGMLSLHGALALVIGVLVVSNLWTLLSLRGSQKTNTGARLTAGRSQRAPPPVPRRVGSRESPDSVADAVKSFLEEYMQQVNEPPDRSAPLDEVAALSATLDALEARIGRLRAQLPAATTPVLPPARARSGLPDVD